MTDIFHHNRWAGSRPVSRAALGCILCLVLLAGPAHGQPPPLRDQFGASAGHGDNLGSVQLAIVVSAKRLRRIKRWEKKIRKHYATIPLLRVADVPHTAPVEYDVVAAKLRKRLPDDINVLVDIDGHWSSEYDLDTRVPNVLVFDAAGELAGKHAGKYKPELFEALRLDLDRLTQSQ